MASSSSSNSGRRWNYDVFINFRGEDTRKIFVGHLYRALKQKAITTFVDSQELRKGNDLSKLLTAIQNSRLSIVVFSEHYASSTWCLKELVEILRCMDTQNQIVVPVFYQVDPSHVRKLKRSFAQAFTKQEEDSNTNTEEVQSWISALTRATNLSGWDSRNYQDDGELIEEIVADIFNKLIQTSSSKANGLVGIDSHIAQMDLLLCPGVDDVRFVGIWGMGGLGKTTIARAVFEKISCQFEHCCFLDNVKEGFTKKGEIQMQEELLGRILMEKEPTVGTLNRGSKMIMERLGKKKVLIVLDDVDDVAQIEVLLGKEHSFGGGSRIILTTRDTQLLRRVDEIYKPNLLTDGEAVKLFRQYAFRTNKPSEEYDNLSRCAIKYAQGLPLALKVLGAFLFDKSIREWEEALRKIMKIPHMGIHGVLKTSFDGLDDSEKDIFLDITCFFRGLDKGYVAEFLDACGFFPHSGLRVLIDRALITISYDNKIEMHDLLQEMGREVVRQESIKEPGRRSRLWTREDVVHVLTQNTGTEAVEGIMLDLSNSEDVYINAEAFVRMMNLRLLRIYYSPSLKFRGYNRHRSGDFMFENRSGDFMFQHTSGDFKFQHMSGDFQFLSHELRCLIWHGYPLKSLPSNFHPKNLVHLDMSYSHLEQLWEGTEHLKKLKFINLKHSQYLNKTTNFIEATNLEELDLSSCESLLEVHSSILAHEKLVFLSLSGCKKLKILPSRIHMKSLKVLNLSGCSNIEKFPEISEVMKELVELYLDATAIEELPSSINNLTSLATLILRGCRQLKILPSSICLKSLKDLDLSGCSNLEKFPEISEVMKELVELYLDATAIQELPSSINNLTSLATLILRGCRQLMILPSRICLKSLKVLDLSGCSNLEKFPEISEVMKELTLLYLDHTAINKLPSSIERLQGLQLVYRRMNTAPKWTEQVRVTLDTMPASACVNDDFSWRKYGQKQVLGSIYPRPYYLRSFRVKDCCAKKMVQLSQVDPRLFEIAYSGMHICRQVPFITLQ